MDPAPPVHPHRPLGGARKRVGGAKKNPEHNVYAPGRIGSPPVSLGRHLEPGFKVVAVSRASGSSDGETITPAGNFHNLMP
ncbi:hypothetical protein GCM10009097_54460 [Pigmentiphaga daeguensis]|uniref:Uncharacterized protein n=1 Tax=Pigmentiphaga daeguensis TaxID=414049 RepID=A0ABN1CZE0_9BURK